MTKFRSAIVYGDCLNNKVDIEELTLQAVIKRAANASVERGITYISKDGASFFQSYSCILSNSEKILRGLRALGVCPGDSVLLQFKNNHNLISVFWACVLGGFIPTPIATFSNHSEPMLALNSLLSVWQLLDKPIIVTDDSLLEDITRFEKTFLLNDVHSVLIENLLIGENDGNWYVSRPCDIVINLLTSGSTGAPKCVQHTHKSIISRIAAMEQLMQFTANEVSLNWMPMEHVGGLVMFHVHDTYLTCQQINAKTEMFLTNPVNWILWMAKYKVTTTWAPNFAFSLLNKYEVEIKNINCDLSSVKFILNGGEMVSVSDVQRFLKILTPLGLPKNAVYPSYGMSETSSGVTISNIVYENKTQGIRIIDKMSFNNKKKELQYADDKQKNRDVIVFAEIGHPIAGVQVRIVSKNNHCLLEDQIGHIQVKGPTLMNGYYKNPSANEEVFLNDGWFKTGDLGFIHNGNVTITGREKDVIVINGENYMAHEIESIIADSISGVEKTFIAACSVIDSNNGNDTLAIFFVSLVESFQDQIAIIKNIKTVLNRKIGITTDFIIPIAKRNFPKTSSGKIQRKQLAQLLASGGLQNIIDKIQLYLCDYKALPKWVYEKDWVHVPIQGVNISLASETFIIFSDEHGFCAAIKNKLLSLNKEVLIVKRGSDFKKISDDLYEIDITNKEHYHNMLLDVKNKNTDLSIIQLFCFDWLPLSYDPVELCNCQYYSIFSNLFLLQALETVKFSSCKLFVVSSLAQPFLLETDVQAQKSAAIGLLKTAEKEFPGYKIRHIDFDLSTQSFDRPLIDLINEIYCTDSCLEVIYRKNKRFICELMLVDVNKIKLAKETFKDNGLYLITGGLGGIGYQLAKYLLNCYNVKLLIIGQTSLAFNKEKNFLYEELLKLGEVTYVNLDIIQERKLLESVEKVESKYKCKLDGVIHMASLDLQDNFTNMERHLLKNESYEYGCDMFKSKILGTSILSRLLKKYTEATFICFSSVMGYLPKVAFGMYAAANSFIDSFVFYHKKHNPEHNVMAIAWSKWDDLNVSTGYSFADISKFAGYENISVYRGLLFLIACVNLKKNHIFVGLSADGCGIKKITSKNEESYESEKIRDDCNCDATDVSLAVKEKLHRIWCEVLDYRNIDDDSDFFECGGSSIIIFRLIGLIRSEFNVDLPIKAIFEYPKFKNLLKVLQHNISLS